MKTWKLRKPAILGVLGVALVILHQFLTGGKTILADPQLLDQVDFDAIWYLGALGIVLIPTAYFCFLWEQSQARTVRRSPVVQVTVPDRIEIPASVIDDRVAWTTTRSHLENSTRLGTC